MSDDLFSRLFELFNQPGPVNWRLAAEVARHMAGEPEPIAPDQSEELRELARLAEHHVTEVAPFPVRPASDVLTLDRRGWAESHLEAYRHLVEPFGESLGDGPGPPMMGQMAPVMIGLQAGSLVGSLSTWAIATFDAGLPPERAGPLAIVVPNLESLGIPDADPREVRLWAVANEVAFRATCDLPWVPDHLGQLAEAYAGAVEIDPTKLSGLVMGGTDPSEIESALEAAGGLERLIGGEQADARRADLEAFVGAVSGCARLLARRATEGLIPSFELIDRARDQARAGSSTPNPVGVRPVPPDLTSLGDEFNQEVERRYGDDALETLWADPSRMPSAAELEDPTAWAARVLLDGWS